MRFGFYSMLENNDEEDHSVMNMLHRAILAMDQKITQQENTYSSFTQDIKKKQHDEAKLSSLMKSALDNNEFILLEAKLKQERIMFLESEKQKAYAIIRDKKEYVKRLGAELSRLKRPN